MFDALDAINDIVEAIEEYGSTVTLNIITAGVYDTATGETTSTVVSFPTKAIPSNYTSREIDNTNIHATDLRFKIYYSGVIDYTYKIVFDGKTYKLMNIDKKIMQDTNLLYEIQGRV